MIQKIKEKISIAFKTVLAAFFCLCPIKKNKIVLESFGGKNYSDNPKMIAQEAVAQHKPWDIVWLSAEKPSDLPQPIRWVKYGSAKAFYEWGTARVWVDNIRHQVRPIKRRGQYYIQTWHGSISLKRIEKDAEDKLDRDYVSSAKKDGRRTDAIVSSCKLMDDMYERAFWLNDRAEILKTGLPRNDVLFGLPNDQAIHERVRQNLHIDTDAFVVLYAPTFRDDRSLDGYIKDFDVVLAAAEKRFHKKGCLLVRMHPNVSAQGTVYQSNPQVMDVSRYPDAQELLIAADCVISDYSSIIFDFVLLKKPGFICALDVDQYNEKRGLLPVFYELPWKINPSTDALAADILSYDEAQYEANLQTFFEKYPIYDDGHAAARIVSIIQSKMK